MIHFVKMHGLGNDFILFDLFQEEVVDFQGLARDLCHRHFGIGADGILLLKPASDSKNQMQMVIYNSDGSEADMCGNGLRCLARYAYDAGVVEKEHFRVETRAGVMVPEINLMNEQVHAIRVNMGKPQFEPENIPVQIKGREVMDFEQAFGDASYRINSLFLGNPHCVIYTQELDLFPIERVGPVIETDSIFPNRTNVEFVQVLNPHEIKMRVWERGAGQTLACGTGACAAAVASIKRGFTNSKVTVHLPGGDLEIEWAENGMVYMSGPAEYVYRGTIQLPNNE